MKSARAFFNNTPDLTEAIRKMVEENAGYKKEIEDFVHAETARIAEKLEKEANKKRKIYFYTKVTPKNKCNSIFLMAAYSV